MSLAVFTRAVLRSAQPVLAITLALTLLALAPFAAALEIHHELAAADHDGHEHSASDLCQWVQHHTGSSVLDGAPADHSYLAVASYDPGSCSLLVSSRAIAQAPARAPPISSSLLSFTE